VISWIVSFLLWLYLQVLGRTSRLAWFGKEHEAGLAARGTPFVLACWHRQQALFFYYFRGRRLANLVSPSKDGEIAARISRWLGLAPVRGSSRKHPARALRELLKTVRAGYSIAITPDGPLGPALEVKPGALYLARALRIPILPLAGSCAFRKTFRSWDAFIFPMPFNRICLVYGEPLWIGPEDDLSAKALQLKEILNRISQEAEDHVAVGV
jgi:lysophospholipid acyltransferase (LPLAT)-like uncharacterized protein